MPVERTLRLNELVKRALSKIIQKEFLPERYGLITITRVIVSGDLQHARVFFTVIGKDENKILDVLKTRQPHIRHRLAQSIKLRFTPELIFDVDKELKQALKVDDMIDHIVPEYENDSDLDDSDIDANK